MCALPGTLIGLVLAPSRTPTVSGPAAPGTWAWDGGKLLNALIAGSDEVRDRVGATLRILWPRARLEYRETGRQAIEAVREIDPDLVVLDLDLSDAAGLDALAAIRRFSSVAMLVIVPCRGESLTWRHTVELGADEYVLAPFVPVELLARAGAVVRQRTENQAGSKLLRPEEKTDRIGQTLAGESRICLTASECAFIDLLAQRPNRVVPFEALLDELWGQEARGRTEFPRVYARRLRERIESDPDEPRYLLTERGAGYLLAESEPSPTVSWIAHATVGDERR